MTAVVPVEAKAEPAIAKLNTNALKIPNLPFIILLTPKFVLEIYFVERKKIVSPTSLLCFNLPSFTLYLNCKHRANLRELPEVNKHWLFDEFVG